MFLGHLQGRGCPSATVLLHMQNEGLETVADLSHAFVIGSEIAAVRTTGNFIGIGGSRGQGGLRPLEL